MHHKKLILTTALCSFLLHGCTGSGSQTGSYKGNGGYNQSKSSSGTVVDRAILKALASAQTDQERLTILAQMHARDPEKQSVAISYAQALRNDEQINASKRVLDPFTKGDNKSAEALTEMAITNIALGDFEGAEKAALGATELSPKNGRAYLAMGTALDAQARHEDAEQAFRKGIDHWQGDPAPILNNLALNLASQGRLEQSLEILRKAKKISPHRMEIERNLRIISTLQETAGDMPPPPNAKPSDKKDGAAEEAAIEVTVEPDVKDVKMAPLPPRKAVVKNEVKEEDAPKSDDEDENKKRAEEIVKEKPKKAVVKYRPLND